LITEDDDAILPACHAFCFQETAEPECALLILQDYVGNLLVTSGCLQSQRENPWINMPVRAKLTVDGLMRGGLAISYQWLRTVAPSTEKRAAVRQDFERLLRLDFERLIGVSGVMMEECAKEEAVMAVDKTFLVW
jgi:hypothetical protein